jgi:uncharacterized protein YjlB
MKLAAHLLAPADGIPNHPRWPLLVYPAVLESPSPEDFEEMFGRNRWPAAWRNGVFPFHHYHSNAHEALGVYAGEVTVLFGGEGGVTVTAKPGDVLVLPAGTGHKKVSSRGRLGIVGAYPQGARPDTVTNLHLSTQAQIAAVPLPAADPVFGAAGPLFAHWQVG